MKIDESDIVSAISWFDFVMEDRKAYKELAARLRKEIQKSPEEIYTHQEAEKLFLRTHSNTFDSDPWPNKEGPYHLEDPSIAVEFEEKFYVLDGQHRMNQKIKDKKPVNVIIVPGKWMKDYGITSKSFQGKTAKKVTASLDEQKLLQVITKVAKEAGFEKPEKAYYQCSDFSKAVYLFAKDKSPHVKIELWSDVVTISFGVGELKPHDKTGHTFLKIGSTFWDFTGRQFNPNATFPHSFSNLKEAGFENSHKLNPPRGLDGGSSFWYNKMMEECEEKTTRKVSAKSSMGVVEYLENCGVKIKNGKVLKSQQPDIENLARLYFDAMESIPQEFQNYIKGFTGAVSAKSMESYRKALQPLLKLLYPSGVLTVYRGTTFGEEPVPDYYLEEQEPFSNEHILSFSENLETAKYFARTANEDGGGFGVVYKVKVPIERVYFHYKLSDLGDLHPNEKEISVLAGGLSFEVLETFWEEEEV